MFHTVRFPVLDVETRRLVTRIESIAATAALASGVGMLLWIKAVTSGVARSVVLMISAMTQLELAESGREKFSRVPTYVGRGCSKGTKKHVRSLVEHKPKSVRVLMLSSSSPEIRKW